MIIAFIKELSLCHKLITISLEPNFEDLRYFKLWILLNQIIGVWNIKGLQHRVLKILGFKYLILLQRLNSFKIINMKELYFATNLIIIIHIFYQPDGLNLWYIKHYYYWITEFLVWNSKGLRNRVANAKVFKKRCFFFSFSHLKI